MQNIPLTCCDFFLSRFTCDDVDFNLRVHSAGLLICRFNHFSVMKKQIAVGGQRSFHIKSKVGTETSVALLLKFCFPFLSLLTRRPEVFWCIICRQLWGISAMWGFFQYFFSEIHNILVINTIFLNSFPSKL